MKREPNSFGTKLSEQRRKRKIATQPPQKQTSGYAIASLVLGIAGLIGIAPLIGSILAIVFANISKKENEPETGMARAGAILGWVVIGFGVLSIIAFILSFLLWGCAIFPFITHH